jgi:hypothetical protein
MRNYHLLAGIGISLGVLVLTLVFAHVVYPLLPELVEEAVKRPLGAEMLPAAWPVNPYAPFAVVIASVCYAVVLQMLIFQFFEKTQSPEIYFFALFVFSFTFECGRMVIPLQHIYALPQAFVAAAERLGLFGRFFGLFALFVSSVYATEPKTQKQGTVLFAITLVSLLFASRVPIDPLAWDTTLRLDGGYRSMFKVVELATALLSVASYLVSARIRGSKEFVQAGIGVLLVFVGRAFLFDADTMYTPIQAFLCLGAGSLLIFKPLHRVYLWI